MVVNVTKYKMFVTPQYDIILRYWIGLTKLLTQRAYFSTRTLLTRYCSMQCVTVVHVNLSALQVRRPDQNTALNAKTEQP